MLTLSDEQLVAFEGLRRLGDLTLTFDMTARVLSGPGHTAQGSGGSAASRGVARTVGVG